MGDSPNQRHLDTTIECLKKTDRSPSEAAAAHLLEQWFGVAERANELSRLYRQAKTKVAQLEREKATAQAAAPNPLAGMRIPGEAASYRDDAACLKVERDRDGNISGLGIAPSKYHVRINGGWADVYDVLAAFGVTNPGDQHAIKKMLMPGRRGAKDANQDRREAIQSLERAIELEEMRQRHNLDEA